MVVFEDVQWADEATLDLTRFPGRRIDCSQGLLLLTYRDGEVDTTHPLRLAIGAIPPHHLVRMPLRPLSRKAVAGGNPLLVTEIVAAGPTTWPPRRGSTRCVPSTAPPASRHALSRPTGSRPPGQEPSGPAGGPADRLPARYARRLSR